MASLTEIQEILRDDKKLSEVAQAAFYDVDSDHSGLIAEPDLWTAICNLANKIGVEQSSDSDKDFIDLKRELEYNRNALISLEEFKVLARQVLELWHLTR